jgi:hypothetical protein
MKTLEQIQEENRKAIIIANNPEAKNYKQALEMELGMRCGVKVSRYCVMSDDVIFYCNKESVKLLGGSEVPRSWIVDIIGKPLTLDRVLIALEDVACDLTLSFDTFAGDNIVNIRLDNPFNCEGKFNWNLTKPTLEEQTEETQRAMNELLNNKPEGEE